MGAARVPSMGMNKSWKEMIGRRDNNRSERQGGCREAFSRKKSLANDTTVGRQTGSEAMCGR